MFIHRRMFRAPCVIGHEDMSSCYLFVCSNHFWGQGRSPKSSDRLRHTVFRHWTHAHTHANAFKSVYRDHMLTLLPFHKHTQSSSQLEGYVGRMPFVYMSTHVGYFVYIWADLFCSFVIDTALISFLPRPHIMSSQRKPLSLPAVQVGVCSICRTYSFHGLFIFYLKFPFLYFSFPYFCLHQF